MSSRCLPALFVLLVFGSAFAQTGSLTGTVRDGETGEALFAANVLVTSLADPSSKVGRLTARNGGFKVESLAPGRYEVRASYIGYETMVIDIVDVTAGGTASVEFVLTIEPIEMNTIIISVSRREEKVIDAPASVQVVTGKEIRGRAVLSPADHLQGRPAVDVQRAGLNQGTVVIRGFNNIFSGATLTLVDNRIARVASLRYNALNLIPTTNEDIEQMEVVSGPGAALYGPNTANGVLHIRTRDPFGSEGTTLSVAGGDQSLLMASGRHAGSHDGKIAWKVTGSVYQGDDFESVDASEQSARTTALLTDPDTRIGLRDFEINRYSGEGRLDIQVNPDLLVILNGGRNEMDAIELTGIGAAQARNWVTQYGQARLRYKDFFFQAYLNANDSGDTYILRTGADLVDESKFFVVQGQHQADVGERTHLVYGVDGQFTRPDTDGTINGRNEDRDSINEIGGYLHAETKLSDQFTFVAAGRIDDHDHIDDPVFSPRAALVYGPKPGHKLRATYNRAFSTPSTNNLFLDLLSRANAYGLGSDLANGFDIRVQGAPEGGFTFRRDTSGGVDGLYMTMPDVMLALNGTTDRSIAADAPLMWEAATEAVALSLEAAGDPVTAAGVRLIPAPPAGLVGTILAKLNPTTGEFEAISPGEVQDIGRTEPTITNTFEVGYKGLIGQHLVAAVDVYYTQIEDFVGPLAVETPNVFMDPTTLSTYLSNPAFGLSPAQVAALTAGIASVPVGTVTPENALDPGDVILTYRNFGEIDLTGVDIGLQILLNDTWSGMLSYSFVSEDFFENVEGELDVALNAPQHKAGATLKYTNRNRGIDGSVRVRYVDGFPVESGVYVGEVDSYALVDLAASWEAVAGTTVSAMVQNLFNNEHQEFVGVPEIGRLALVRVTQLF